MEKAVVIVSFSSRKQGNCEQITDFLENIYNRTNVLSFKFSNFDIHACGGCQYECFQERTACPYIEDMEYRLLESITQSKMAYFIVPNYCDYPCANFFVFNERSQCYFQGKPELLEQYLNVPKKFVVISNSYSDRFRDAFTQHCSTEPNVMLISAKELGKVSTSNDLMESPALQEKLRKFAQTG